jgi:hypothetical protein
MRLVSVFASAALVASCGGGDSQSASPASATFTGSVRGNSFTPRDATAGIVSFNVNGLAGKAAVIAITSAPALCSALEAGKQPRSTQYLALTPFKLQPDFSAIPPPSPGVYQVGALTIENGVALFSTTDASCEVVPANTVRASTGTITLTAVGSRYTGSYELFFEFGDSVKGTFDAPVCGDIDLGALQAGTLACQ